MIRASDPIASLFVLRPISEGQECQAGIYPFAHELV